MTDEIHEALLTEKMKQLEAAARTLEARARLTRKQIGQLRVARKALRDESSNHA